MKLPPALRKSFARFDALSIRERALVAFALLAALIMIWTIAVLDPISARQRHLLSEMSTLQESIAATSQSLDASESSPVTAALASEKKLHEELEALNVQLASKSGGLVPPERVAPLLRAYSGAPFALEMKSEEGPPRLRRIRIERILPAWPSTAGAASRA